MEVHEQLETYTDSVWIPATEILSFIVDKRPGKGAARLCIEAERIRNVSQHPVTPWLDSVEDAESARWQLIRMLADAQPTQVLRWDGSGFACSNR